MEEYYSMQQQNDRTHADNRTWYIHGGGFGGRGGLVRRL